MKEARYKRLNIVWFHLYELSRIGECIETESKLVVIRDQRRRNEEWPPNGMRLALE